MTPMKLIDLAGQIIELEIFTGDCYSVFLTGRVGHILGCLDGPSYLRINMSSFPEDAEVKPAQFTKDRYELVLK